MLLCTLLGALSTQQREHPRISLPQPKKEEGPNLRALCQSPELFLPCLTFLEVNTDNPGTEIIKLFLGFTETKMCLMNICLPTSQLRSNAGRWESLELPTCWTYAISTHIKSLSLLPFMATEFFLSCWWEKSLSLLSRYFPQVLLSLMAILSYYVYFPGSQRMLMNVKPTFLSVAGFPNVVREQWTAASTHANQAPSAQEAACRNRQLFCSMQGCLGRGSSCREVNSQGLWWLGAPQSTLKSLK